MLRVNKKPSGYYVYYNGVFWACFANPIAAKEYLISQITKFVANSLQEATWTIRYEEHTK